MENFRVIPALILQNGSFVKGRAFKKHRYVGDPMNILKIFNDKDVDEISIVDPFTSKLSTEYISELQKIISYAYLPVSFGGALYDIGTITSLNRIGVEKFIFKLGKNLNKCLLKEVSQTFGSQSVILHLPVIFLRDKSFLYPKNLFQTQFQFQDIIEIQDFIGEILITNVLSEGKRNSEISFSKMVPVMELPCPVLYQGGVASKEDLKVLKNIGYSGCCVGASFVFVGKRDSVNVGYFKL